MIKRFFLKTLFLLITIAIFSGCKNIKILNYSSIDFNFKHNYNSVVKEYIIRNSLPMNNGDKLFCTYRIIEKEENNKYIKLYLMVYIQAYSYESENHILKKGVGAFFPASITVEHIGNNYGITEYINSLIVDEQDAERLFPRRILDVLKSGKYSRNDIVNVMEAEIIAEAKNYYEVR